MSRTTRRGATRVAAAGAILAMILGVAACGSSSNTDSSAPGSAASGPDSADADQVTDPASGQHTADEAGAAPSQSADAGTTAGSEPAGTAPPNADGQQPTLTIYTGQHESLVKDITDHFTADTGIPVKLRAGHDAELANQLIEEGSGSPADVFLTEEPGPIGMVASKGLLEKVDQSTLDQIDPRLVPSTQDWMPYAARSRVIFYNTKMIKPEQLPNSVMDLTKPKWKGKFAYAPSGAFTSTVSYLIDTIGKDKTLAWLKGIKANGINEQHNGKVRDSVEAGQHAFGISNHYYWYFLAEEKGGKQNLDSRVYYFDHPDAGGLLLPSGAGILKASKHQAEAQKFLAWLGSADGGQKFISEAPAAQYPVGKGVTSQVGLPPLDDLHFPEVDPAIYSNTGEAKDLIVAAGIV